jgi:hypothetical protein
LDAAPACLACVVASRGFDLPPNAKLCRQTTGVQFSSSGSSSSRSQLRSHSNCALGQLLFEVYLKRVARAHLLRC